MSSSFIRFPVVCPKCGKEQLFAGSMRLIERQLRHGERIRLHARCHGASWDASPAELEQIGGYLSALRLGNAHCGH